MPGDGGHQGKVSIQVGGVSVTVGEANKPGITVGEANNAGGGHLAREDLHTEEDQGGMRLKERLVKPTM